LVPESGEALCPCGTERPIHPYEDGRCYRCIACECVDPDIDVFGSSGALLVWNIEGGAAGIGPTLVIDEGGTALLWMETGWLGDGALPEGDPDMAASFSITRVPYLHNRLRTGLGGVPHGPNRVECEQRIFARDCSDCVPRTSSFGEIDQILPELGCFLDLLQSELPREMYEAMVEACRWTG
jgi:hypothetical protein